MIHSTPSTIHRRTNDPRSDPRYPRRIGRLRAERFNPLSTHLWTRRARLLLVEIVMAARSIGTTKTIIKVKNGTFTGCRGWTGWLLWLVGHRFSWGRGEEQLRKITLRFFSMLGWKDVLRDGETTGSALCAARVEVKNVRGGRTVSRNYFV